LVLRSMTWRTEWVVATWAEMQSWQYEQMGCQFWALLACVEFDRWRGNPLGFMGSRTKPGSMCNSVGALELLADVYVLPEERQCPFCQLDQHKCLDLDIGFERLCSF
jgi:hypothetical protein